MKVEVNKLKQILFLHGGPGLNTEIERKWFEGRFSDIEFWDQPACATFGELLQFAEKKLLEMSGDKKIKIAAHSFGCELVRYFILKYPEKIEKVNLIAPCHRLPLAFNNLSKKLSNDPQTPAEIREELKSALKKIALLHDGLEQQVADFFKLAEIFIKDPNYSRFYIKNAKTAQKYGKLSAGCKPFDLTVWRNVINDFMLNWKPVQKVETTIPLKIFVGSDDPYVILPDEEKFLSGLYPGGKIYVMKNSAHYLYLEDNEEEVFNF